MEEFRKLGLSDNVITALEKKGYKEPTDVQSKVIPLLLGGEKDVIAQSQTGTGKTASFAIPIIERLQEAGIPIKKKKTIQAVILAPTRELASQVADEINTLKGTEKIKVLAVYGGAAIGPQKDKLRIGVDIVVGTPGRVMDLQRQKVLKLDDIKYAVLDEADEMLNMGFVEDIEMILKNTPKEKSMLLFSATMPPAILKIAKTYMKDYEFVEIQKKQLITDTLEQIYYDINARDRVEGLRRIIDYYPDFHGIVFCNTKDNVDVLTAQLVKKNHRAAALHGDISQSSREKILAQFKRKDVRILVATDVAARGIDVNDLSHVVNFSLPQSPEGYVHRIGRTGRAGKKGIAITFVIPSEKGKLSFVERVNNCKLQRRELPSPQDIVGNKEEEVKEILKNIIAKTSKKVSKYDLMAEDLLKESEPKKIIAAILKYSFKNDLEASAYKEMSKVEPARGSRSRSRRNDSRGSGGFRGRDGRFGSNGGDSSGSGKRRFGNSSRSSKGKDFNNKASTKKSRKGFKNKKDQ